MLLLPSVVISQSDQVRAKRHLERQDGPVMSSSTAPVPAPKVSSVPPAELRRRRQSVDAASSVCTEATSSTATATPHKKKRRLRLLGRSKSPAAAASTEDAQLAAAKDMTSSFEAIAAAAVGLSAHPRRRVSVSTTTTQTDEAGTADASVGTTGPSPDEAEEILAQKGEDYCVMFRYGNF